MIGSQKVFRLNARIQKFMEDYKSTSDSEHWRVKYIEDVKLNQIFIVQVPVALLDSTSLDQTSPEDNSDYVVPCLETNKLKGLVMEPLLYIPEKAIKTIASMSGASSDFILVTASVYSIKSLIYSTPNCILFEDYSEIGILVPRRILIAASKDCISKYLKVYSIYPSET